MNPANAANLFGSQDRHLKTIEDAFGIEIHSRGEHIELRGLAEDTQTVTELFFQLETLLNKGQALSERDIITAVKMASNGTLEQFINLYDEQIGRTFDGKIIRAKSLGQRHYLNTVKHQAVTFGIGPAGTGKTFLAVIMAVAELKAGRVSRIILTRPAVEAGESLGFLPGDLKEKVDPYLRPVYDALHAIYGQEHTERLMERGVIEIAPLAYMRGRTLDEAFVILDEAQNTTVNQMKMFLTRLGFGSKMIVNGDATQIDLPRGVRSGLIDAKHKLKHISDIGFVEFDTDDVVRHPVVSAIINAYGDADAKRDAERKAKQEVTASKSTKNETASTSESKTGDTNNGHS